MNDEWKRHWFVDGLLPGIALWAFAVAYIFKWLAFSKLVQILVTEDSTEQLGRTLTRHYIWIKWQALVIGIMLTSAAFNFTFDVQIIPQPFRALIYITGAFAAAKVTLTARKLMRIAQGNPTLRITTS